jgi:hypothetical protein
MGGERGDGQQHRRVESQLHAMAQVMAQAKLPSGGKETTPPQWPAALVHTAGTGPIPPTRGARGNFAMLHSTLLFCWPICEVPLARAFTEGLSNRRHYSTHDLRRPEYQGREPARFRRQTYATCKGEREWVGTDNKTWRVMRS